MRITNQMITNTTLRNMQKSMKTSSDKYDQMTTGKKIQRASEDPVVAVRSLKLRTTVSQLAQYKDKNIKDAAAWIDTTTGSITSVIGVLSRVSEYCTQGSTDSFNETDRQSIVDTLKSYKDIINSTGGTAYAGRYIFSGYKTDTNLIFDSEVSIKDVSYDIKQSLSINDINVKNTVLNEVSPTDITNILNGGTYTSPTESSVYSMRLGYDNLDESVQATVTYTDKNGNNISLTPTVLDTTQIPYYDKIQPDTTYYIPETGEIIFGETVYGNIQRNIDPKSSIDVTYSKDTFKVGDLRPEHYFDCVKSSVEKDGTTKTTTFTQPEGGQQISYEVNFSQTMVVNVEGKDVIKHSMGNAIDDLANAVQEVLDAEATKEKLTSMLSDPLYSGNPTATAQIKLMLDDIDTEIALKKENMQKLFGNNISTFNAFIKDVTSVQSLSATRTNKLQLIEERVIEQHAIFEDLMSSNEDVDSADAIIAFNQAEQAYNLTLAATSNVIQKTLLDYL